MPHWRILELELEGDTVLVVLAHGPDRITLLANIAFPSPGIAVLSGLHAQGAGPNRVGPGNLFGIARWVREVLDVRELRIEGALRTSGARPGRYPAPIVFR